jgi:hypothetical protein
MKVIGVACERGKLERNTFIQQMRSLCPEHARIASHFDPTDHVILAPPEVLDRLVKKIEIEKSTPILKESNDQFPQPGAVRVQIHPRLGMEHKLV